MSLALLAELQTSILPQPLPQPLSEAVSPSAVLSAAGSAAVIRPGHSLRALHARTAAWHVAADRIRSHRFTVWLWGPMSNCHKIQVRGTIFRVRKFDNRLPLLHAAKSRT